ncbi:MAG TPA: hypothetical protein PLS31_08235, partial [Candidatus Sumerlaeota bacterium]|nr:hypothetical protein [Candidatus Sumerlaeota bacterium]
MTAQGWIFMIASWAIITGLCFYCFRLIFKSKTENIVYPLDVESQLERNKTPPILRNKANVRLFQQMRGS